jgi:signal transduction histidine kinase
MHDIDSKVDKYMLDLRPVVLDDLGLSAALRSQCMQWSDLHQITANAHLENLDEHALPFEIATTAYRVVQESLTNVAKHSNATAVDVIAEIKGSELRIVVEDNGDGASEGRSFHSYGLVGLRERVESLGGECRYESSAGNGFSVFVKIPVSDE